MTCPGGAHAALVNDLREVVVGLPGADLVPVPGPLGPDNRVYWGKLPSQVEHELISIGALIPDDRMLRASPVLLSRLMILLAKHLAAATRGAIPFTDSPSAHQIAFRSLRSDLPARLCWQLRIGEFLPVPTDDTPLVDVLRFRQAYSGERDELATAVRKLLNSVPDPAEVADPAEECAEIEKALQQIRQAVRQLEKASHGSRIVWQKRSLLVLGGLGAAAGSVAVPPLFAALLVALSALGIGAATVVTRPGVSNDYAYLQHLQFRFRGAGWPSATSLR